LTPAQAAAIAAAGGLSVSGSFPPCAVISPTVVRGAFKIAENESPRPQNRVFGTFNYFSDVNGSLNAPDFPQTNVYRGVCGFEKTLLDGNASIGLRVPIIQMEGDHSIASDGFGDLSFVLKYAFINNPDTVLSGGMVVTAPTGESFLPAGVPDIHSTLLQPWVGGIRQFGNVYIHGFSSVVVPTDDRDVTIWLNDLGIGYFLYQCGDACAWVTALVPTFEVHVNTPLNHRGVFTEPIGMSDIVNLTCGLTIGLCERSSLMLGAVTPVTGPKPFDVESQVYFNWRF
jgi:hypothetical protein